MIPMFVAFGGILGAAAIGLALDRALGSAFAARGPLGWALRIFAGLAAVLACALHPLALAGLAAVHGAIGRARPRDRAPASPAQLAVLGLGALAILVRPAVPLYWDEHVWLARARLGAGEPLALRAAALDPSADVIPSGYPVLASLAESLLAAGGGDLAALVAGSAAFVGLALAVALALLPARRAAAWALCLLHAPLAWIHLRSAYLDLVVGLLAVALCAALAAAREHAATSLDPGSRCALLHAAVPVAFVLAGTKDEGLVHVVALALAHLATSRERRAAARQAAPIVASALLAAGTWQTLLAVHGVENRDHAITFAGLAEAPAIALELARGATDLHSFGLAWPLVFGAATAAIARGAPLPRTLAWAFFAQACALVLGLLAGSERLRAFALDGTLSARLWMQLWPVGAWLLVEVLADWLARDHAASATGSMRA